METDASSVKDVVYIVVVVVNLFTQAVLMFGPWR